MDTARNRIYHVQEINHDLVLARLDVTPHTRSAVHDEADLERRGTLRLGLRRVRSFLEQARCLRPELLVGRLARLERGRCASGPARSIGKPRKRRHQSKSAMAHS